MKPRTILRAFTGDRGPPTAPERVEIHTREQIGPNRALTPSGFLLCSGVPIARVGWMIYGPGETPIAVSKATGLAYVNRTADDLFSPECMGSFMGSPIVDEHPDPSDYPDGVTPATWRELSKGFSLSNVRRGEGRDSDVMLADLLITDADLIASVNAGKREVSGGYDADYEQTGDGEGRQFNIIGNHIALVEKGRCGPRCAIGDRAHQPEGNTMPTTMKKPATGIAKRRAVLDARRKVLDAETALQDVEEADQGMAADTDEGGGSGSGDTHIHIHGPGGMDKPKAETSTDGEGEAGEGDEGGGDDRIGKLETAVAAITETLGSLTEVIRKMGSGGNSTDSESEEDEDEDDGTYDEESEEEAPKQKEEEVKSSKTTDSAALATGYAKVQSQAEILVPGFRMATFDAKAKRASTVDAMCSARRKALGLACSTADGLALVTSVSGGTEPNVDKMDCKGVATLFVAAAGAKALLNNRTGTHDANSLAKLASGAQAPVAITPASLNAANKAFWDKMAAAPK